MNRIFLGSLGKQFAAGSVMAGCFVFANQSTATAQHRTLPPNCPPPVSICPPVQSPRYMEPSIAPPMGSDTQSPTPVDPGMTDAVEPAPSTPIEDFADQQPAFDLQTQPAPATTGQAQVAQTGLGGLPPGVSGIGDFLGFNAFDFTVQTLSGGAVTSEQRVFSPTAINRTFKIVENQRPQPIDRVFVNTNYFSDVDGAGTDFYRYSIGVEKTFADDQASLLLFVPMYTLNPGDFGAFNSSGGSDTEVGDVTVALKYVLMSDCCSQEILTGGAAVTIPTGPDTIGDVEQLFEVDLDNNGSIQPYLIYAKGFDNGLYFQGYTGLDVPFDGDAPTFWFNSISTGYVMNTGLCGISAIIPKAEIHVNTPLNNDTINVRPTRLASQIAAENGLGSLNIINNDIPDTVNFTYGVTALVCGCSELTVAASTPLTGDQLFDYEVQVQYSLLCR